LLGAINKRRPQLESRGFCPVRTALRWVYTERDRERGFRRWSKK